MNWYWKLRGWVLFKDDYDAGYAWIWMRRPVNVNLLNDLLIAFNKAGWSNR